MLSFSNGENREGVNNNTGIATKILLSLQNNTAKSKRRKSHGRVAKI